MRTADTILGLIKERGQKGLPLERLYKVLFNRDLFLEAYGKIYRNQGAMTHGVTEETPDGMSLAKIEAIIEALRYERYLCPQRMSDGASLREEKVCPDCPLTKNRPERGLERLLELSAMFNRSTTPLRAIDFSNGYPK